jgi:hypothetical protein
MRGRVHIMFDLPGHAANGYDWPTAIARELASDPRIASYAVHRLGHVCDRFPAAADWLVELELAADADARSLVTDYHCAELLYDLGQLQAHPRVHIVLAP